MAAASEKQEIASLALSIVGGELDVLEGCRRIVDLRGSLGESEANDPDLLVIVGVESELDDVPSGATRELWAPDALAARDAERDEYLSAVRPELLRACQSIAARWGPSI